MYSIMGVGLTGPSCAFPIKIESQDTLIEQSYSPLSQSWALLCSSFQLKNSDYATAVDHALTKSMHKWLNACCK